MADELHVRPLPDHEDGGLRYLVWREGEGTWLGLTETTFARWDVGKIERMYDLCLKFAGDRMVGFTEYEPGRFICAVRADMRVVKEREGCVR